MAAIGAALALFSGVAGAGFASGREIVRFFAVHGRMAYAGAALSVLLMGALFLRIASLMRRLHAPSLPQLCRLRLGERFGLICGALFCLLHAVTGGAMLAACAELGALTLPIRSAYGAALGASLLLAMLLSIRDAGLALPGAALAALMPALLVRLLALPAGEACFLPAMRPAASALCDGACYAALSAAQLGGLIPMLAEQSSRLRRRTLLLFAAMLSAALLLALAVCLRHISAVVHQPLPFVYLSRSLGRGAYLPTALCLYAAALTTLCAMLRALRRSLGPVCCALCCLIPALLGFDTLVGTLYPLLSALCAGLLVVLCAPTGQKDSPSSR